MLLTCEQVGLLSDDLDYILPRTRCNTVPLTKSRILREIEKDADVLLDLIEGMAECDARFLSVPLDRLRSLISSRQRGVTSKSQEAELDLLTSCEG